MIARLRQPLGWTKEDLASSLEVSVRTIERYIVLFRDLGFNVVQQGSRFKIEQPGRNAFRHEDLIVFTLEEAKIIKDAIAIEQKSQAIAHRRASCHIALRKTPRPSLAF